MLIGDLCLCMTPARRHWTRWAPGRDWRWSPECVRGLDLNHGQQLRCRGGGGGDHTHPRHSRATDKFRGHGDTWVGGRHWSLPPLMDFPPSGYCPALLPLVGLMCTDFDKLDLLNWIATIIEREAFQTRWGFSKTKLQNPVFIYGS